MSFISCVATSLPVFPLRRVVAYQLTLRTFHFVKERFRVDLAVGSGVGIKPIPQGAAGAGPGGVLAGSRYHNDLRYLV